MESMEKHGDIFCFNLSGLRVSVVNKNTEAVE